MSSRTQMRNRGEESLAQRGRATNLRIRLMIELVIAVGHEAAGINFLPTPIAYYPSKQTNTNSKQSLNKSVSGELLFPLKRFYASLLMIFRWFQKFQFLGAQM
jgi:hypothetical protein